ncbi:MULTISPECIES: helix-turn-helix transcriptional regulator [Streptomyces]|uniref:Helix-turn-helix domain-containing protein n=1 Tax=Streptomyces lycii TaxID=2654337 RepID=A0ABQ7FJE9_9ACTN|nr:MULTISPECIES: helix-turn-helix transcriptional regulator [Streptomyces]KAF4409106.1 helix-turn-helix domain-containing protein [Streptomyces lycii]PGH47619.1 transcriptional regulator [Streptomyces sp. Ru87]
MSAARPGHEPSIRRFLEHPQGGPTVLRIVLGTQLRKLREANGVSAKAAADVIRGSHAKISRLELGRVGFKERDVADLLTLYNVTDEDERADFLTLARRAAEPGWWHQYNDILPPWFETHLGLEEAASVIRSYENQFVPGLLQTEGYARAVTTLGHPRASGAEIERRVRLRMTRQQLLDRPGAPRLWAVLDEASLRRPLGGAPVMRQQLRHLIEVSRMPNVVLQIAPFSIGGVSAAGGPITILRFLEPDLPDIVYLEQLTSALYLDKPEDLDNYLAVMDRLCAEADPPSATVPFLEKLLAELT